MTPAWLSPDPLLPAFREAMGQFPVRTVAHDPDKWDEAERPLSPEEMPYLLAVETEQ